MKIPLEKPAVNISKLTAGKNKKARRGAMHEKLRLDLFCLQEIMNGNQNNLNMWYVNKRLSNWNFITYIQCTADKVSLAFYSLLLLTNYENI